jgi:hypothetical protein
LLANTIGLPRCNPPRRRSTYPLQLTVDLFEFPQGTDRDPAAYPQVGEVMAPRVPGGAPGRADAYLTKVCSGNLRLAGEADLLEYGPDHLAELRPHRLERRDVICSYCS